jgi:protein-S-isoprenylcysteine O-methyltransferase Ste14
MHNHVSAHALELKIPRVALVILAALLMWIGAAFFQEFNFQIPFELILASICGFLGLIASTLGVLEFKRAKTTVNPTKPRSSSSLVTSGIYRRTRNPMYLGFLLILVGWAIMTPNLLGFLVLPSFILYMNRFQIEPEERALTSLFGDEFRAYCSTARRWI